MKMEGVGKGMRSKETKERETMLSGDGLRRACARV